MTDKSRTIPQPVRSMAEEIRFCAEAVEDAGTWSLGMTLECRDWLLPQLVRWAERLEEQDR